MYDSQKDLQLQRSDLQAVDREWVGVRVVLMWKYRDLPGQGVVSLASHHPPFVFLIYNKAVL